MDVSYYFGAAFACLLVAMETKGHRREFAAVSFFYWLVLVLWWPMLETSPDNYWLGYAALDAIMAGVVCGRGWSRVVAVTLALSAVMYVAVWLEPRIGEETYYLYDMNTVWDIGVFAVYLNVILWPDSWAYLAAVCRHFYQKAVQRL